MGNDVIVYFVNGEEQSTETHKVQVRLILENAGLKPAEDYVLIRENGNKRFEDLNEELPIHKDERFTALYRGTTPVS